MRKVQELLSVQAEEEIVPHIRRNGGRLPCHSIVNQGLLVEHVKRHTKLRHCCVTNMFSVNEKNRHWVVICNDVASKRIERTGLYSKHCLLKKDVQPHI